MNINITKATVLLTEDADKVHVQTTLPSPLPPTEPLAFSFDAAHDTGVEYVTKVFGIRPDVVDMRG